MLTPVCNQSFGSPFELSPENPLAVIINASNVLPVCVKDKLEYVAINTAGETFSTKYLDLKIKQNGTTQTTALQTIPTQKYTGIEKDFRINLVEDLLKIISQGFWARDMVRAGGGVKTLYDYLTCPRKLSEFYWDSTSLKDLYKEMADLSSQKREAAITIFITQLKKLSELSPEKIQWAISTIPMKITGNDSCNDFTSYFIGKGFFPHDAFKCADEIIRETFPIQLIKQLLLAPNDPNALAELLLKTGEWLEENDNWMAAQYIYEQIADSKDIIAGSVSETAKKKIYAIAGSAEKRSPFLNLLFPEMPWNYSALSSAEKYAYPEELLGFGVSIYTGAKLFSGATFLAKNGFSLFVKKVPYFQKFASAFKTAFSKAAPVSKVIEETANAATAKGVTATAQVATKVGPFSQKLAKVLGIAGGKSYAAWDMSFGALGRFVRTKIAPFLVAIAKPAINSIKNTASNPEALLRVPAKVLTATAKSTGWILKNTFGQGHVDYKPYLFAWWGLMAIGEPFVNGIQQAEDDIALPMLKSGLCGSQLNFSLQLLTGAEMFAGKDFALQQSLLKLNKALWEKSFLQPKKKALDCKDVSAP